MKKLNIISGKIYNLREVAEITRLSISTLRKYIASGKLRILTDKWEDVKIAGYQIEEMYNLRKRK